MGVSLDLALDHASLLLEVGVASMHGRFDQMPTLSQLSYLTTRTRNALDVSREDFEGFRAKLKNKRVRNCQNRVHPIRCNVAKKGCLN